MKLPFTRKLLKWNNDSNTRSMPWKRETDPYKIWLSEIILQQTRVEQGLNYYHKFVSTYPSVHDLASAPEQEVFKLWEGLGYYSRCKNLIASAKLISNTLNGKFPDSYESIRSLKGIGPYTAAAISSFAFNLPYAVVDGNVSRVLSRYFGISTPIDNTDGKKLFFQLADALLPKTQPGLFNQAIMDFGAVICKPQQPLCNICVQKKDCEAFKHNWIRELPVKGKKLVKKTRWFNYFVINYNETFYIRKRNGKDIWENLYEFVLNENDGPADFSNADSLQQQVATFLGSDEAEILQVSNEYIQQLTHQTIIGRFVSITISSPAALLNDYKSVPVNELSRFPFPKFITSYLTAATEV